MLFTQKSEHAPLAAVSVVAAGHCQAGGVRAFSLGMAWLALAFLLCGCQPSGPKSLLLGAKYIKEGDYPRALRHLEKAADLMPAHPQVWNHLGLAWHGARQPNKAAEAYQRALRIDAKFAPAHFNLGMLLLEEGRLNDAVAALGGFVSLQPTNSLGLAKLGHALLLARRPDDAERALAEALRLNPKDAEAHNHLGLVHVQRKRMRDAMLEFSSALEARPNFAPAILNQGIIAQTYLGNSRAAIERYRAFATLTPDAQRKAEVNLYVARLEEALHSRPAEVAEATNRFNLPPAVQTNATAAVQPVTNPPPPMAEKPLPSATNLLAMRARSNALALARTNAAPTKPQAPEPAKKDPEVAAVPAPAPATNPPPAEPEPEPAPIQVVEVVDEPELKPATDVRANETKLAAATPAEPAPLIAPRKDRAAEARPGLLERANPLRWFRGDDSSGSGATARPASPAPPPIVREPRSETPPPARQRPEFARYPHQQNLNLPKGNRAEAERYFSQGARAHQERRLAAAVENYRQAVTADPSYFEAQYNLGLAAYQMKDLPLALAANENAARLKPESADARYHFAITLRDANYPVDAAEQLRQLLGESPNEARAHLALANLYAQVLDEAALAQRHYQALLELAPNHPEAPAIRQWLAARR